MAWLTKSRFLAGLQCPKRLWFEVNQPLTDAPVTALNLLQGRSFDKVVQTLAPGIVISREKGMPSAIAQTTAVLKAGGAPVLYQPAFRAGDLAVIADIVRKRRTSFELVEVKASTSVKEQHVPDAAFQTLVMRNAGLAVSAVFIGHVDNRFVLKRAGDYAGIAVEADVTPQVEASLQQTADTASDQLAIIGLPEAPEREMGAHCTSPYDCPFIARCSAARAAIPDFPVEVLPRGGKLINELREEGYEDLRSVPRERLTNPDHRRVHGATVSGKPFFDVAPTQELRGLGFPRAYLDFETIGPSVPEVIGTRPYEQWPFQWSLHVEIAASEMQHYEYLAIESFGDFEPLAAALVAAMPETGPIFVYNASFERAVLQRLADRLPQYAEALTAFRDRLYDLWPVTKDAYYHRDMRGSWSIKRVLPTIDPALAYEDLADVMDGEAAQLAFIELRGPDMTPSRRAALLKSLVDYCARDTWGMVILRRFLCGEPPAESAGRLQH